VFQSPIYGSRTAQRAVRVDSPRGFNPLSTGHARFITCWDFIIKARFNPLSTGHAPLVVVRIAVVQRGFNPLSTGHARRRDCNSSARFVSFNPLSTGHARHSSRKLREVFSVSIPYLRVTHEGFTSGGGRSWRVSIPYLRVTHSA